MGKSTYNPRQHWVFGSPTCQKLAPWWGRREMGAWWGHVMTIIDGPHFLCIGGKSGGVESRSCGIPFSGQQKTGVSASFCASSCQRPRYCWSPVCFEIRMKENQASFACFRPRRLPLLSGQHSHTEGVSASMYITFMVIYLSCMNEEPYKYAKNEK